MVVEKHFSPLPVHQRVLGRLNPSGQFIALPTLALWKTKAGCNQLAMFFADKLNQIQADLDFGLDGQDRDSPGTSSGIALWDPFSLVLLEDTDRIVGEVCVGVIRRNSV